MYYNLVSLGWIPDKTKMALAGKSDLLEMSL